MLWVRLAAQNDAHRNVPIENICKLRTAIRLPSSLGADYELRGDGPRDLLRGAVRFQPTNTLETMVIKGPKWFYQDDLGTQACKTFQTAGVSIARKQWKYAWPQPSISPASCLKLAGRILYSAPQWIGIVVCSRRCRHRTRGKGGAWIRLRLSSRSGDADVWPLWFGGR